ncbi:MAG: GNAT family N-acetyltransferase [Chthoniobacterales bacterium]
MRRDFEIRLATVPDVEIIARQRARMFHEMGLVPDHLFESYRTQCETRLRGQLASGEYVGWLAQPVAQPDKIVAGVGAQRRRVLPHPVGEPGCEIVIAEGRHAIVTNVFTDPDWRRRGLATSLMNRLIAWARTERLDRLVLHASEAGRLVYERLGFIQTNEMRFKDRLDVPETGQSYQAESAPHEQDRAADRAID